MTVYASKPEVNIREKLKELDKPSGIAGEAMLRADTPQEQFNLIGAGRKNLIINGDFQVSQRGDWTSPTTVVASTYYIDRWRMDQFGATGTIQHLKNQVVDGIYTNTMKIVCSVAGSGFIDPVYKIEHQSALRNKVVTLSMYVRGNVPFYLRGGSLGTAPTYKYFGVLTDNWKKVSFTYSIPDTTNNHYFGIGPYNGGNYNWSVGEYFEVALAQLELGSVATPFEHRSYGEELALCQRYYTIVQYGSTASNAGFNNSYGCWFTTPTTMRAAPTITHKGNFYAYPGAILSNGNVALQTIDRNGTTLYRVYYPGNSTYNYLEGIVALSAEL